jgi:hypothetical protein
MGTTIKTICGAGGANTGQLNCEYIPKNWGADILIPKGKTFSPSEQLAMVATLKALAKNPNKAKRCYMIGRYTSATEKGTEQVTTTSNYGVVSFVRDGKVGSEHMIENVGMCTWKSLRAFQDSAKKCDVLRIDPTSNCIVGTQKPNGYMGGFELDSLFIGKPDFNDGSKAFMPKVELQFADLIEWENFQIVEIASPNKAISIASGLKDATVEVVTPMTAVGVVVLKLTSSCGFVNEGATQGADLAIVGAWQAVQDSNGTSFPIASVSYNSTTNNYTVTVTLPAVGAFPLATTATINLVDVAALEALATPIVGIEGIGATVTRI